MSKTKGNVVDPLAVDRRGRRRRAALRAHPRRDARPGPAVRAAEARARPELREQALERGPLRPRARGRRRRRGCRAPAPATLATSARRSAGSGRAPRRRPRRSTARLAEYQFAEVTRALYDGIWSEFCDWGLELAKVRLNDAALTDDDARGDVVDAGRFARHVPPPAPSGHAVHHRGDLGGVATARRAIRSC